ncbi:hypothetical protein NHX12_019923, partial [Muraenolepis orangiensis]
MDSDEGPAQRPVTLDIAVEDFANASLAPDETTMSNQAILPPEETIDLGGEFVTPLEDSTATPSESLLDKLNDQMMESVMISDSPNVSEEDDVAPIESFLETVDHEDAAELEASLCTVGTPEVILSVVETKAQLEEQERPELEVEEGSDHEDLQAEMGEKVTVLISAARTPSPPSVMGEELATHSALEARPNDKPVPVCTIFSQGNQPKTLVPDGFQPTLIKSPSFSMASGGGSDGTGTPSKLTPPLVCQPSPSLSKFFSDNGQMNPASDFFDSFTTSSTSSFISVSNPNADAHIASPTSVTPEHQRSSAGSSLSTPYPGPQADSGVSTPSALFGVISGESSTPVVQTQPPLPQGDPAVTPQAQTFNQLQAVFPGSDDPFATALSLSEVDRRHDAWLPSNETRKVLISVGTQQYNQTYAERDKMTMPGLKFDNLQSDAVKDLMLRFLGEQAAMKRQVLTANSVAQSFLGLKQLIAASLDGSVIMCDLWVTSRDGPLGSLLCRPPSTKNWRAAVDLTGRLLTAHGQGYGKSGQERAAANQNTLEGLWFVRLALLCKLNLFQSAELEMEPFGNLEQPDLYYEFYPAVYPGRR